MAKSVSKKELSRQVRRIHRSTVSRWPRFASIHDKLRQRFKWYYRWHTFRASELIHFIILLAALALFFGLVVNYYRLREEVKYVGLDYTIVGKKGFLQNEKATHLDFKDGRLVLEKESSSKYYQVGLWYKKIEMSEPVIWQTISWTSEVPPETKIILRTKGSDLDEEGIWQKIPWSGEYIRSGSRIIQDGSFSPKSRFLKLEIYLEGDGYNTPSIREISLHYLIPPKEGPLTAWIQDKLRKYLPPLLEKIWTRLQRWEGIE